MDKRDEISYIQPHMTGPSAPKVPKWAFFAGDIFLLAVGWLVAFKSPTPLGHFATGCLVLTVLAGAMLAVLPFLLDHRREIKASEVADLKSAMEQIENLRGVANQISFATAQWQLVQEQAGKTITAATEISDRMTAESQSFTEFLSKANDTEKAHLRLEVEKMRRGEGEWLQTIVRILDHVYALYLAGVRSGQAGLKEQLGNFQNACRDAARRMGLATFDAKADEAFDDKRHQLADPNITVLPGARVSETLATGFTYQGKIVRPAVVTLKAAADKVTATAKADDEEAVEAEDQIEEEADESVEEEEQKAN